MELVSVIVPVYNGENFLCECLDSVLAQTYQMVELIVVDDGSTDATPEIADRYRRQNGSMRYVRKDNGGQAAARNEGLRHAGGSLIYFLDADDVLHPRALESLARAMHAGVGVDMVVSEIRWTDAPTYRFGNKYTLCDGKKLLEDTLYQKRGTHSSLSARLIRREVLDRAGFLPEGIIYEDLAYMFPLHCACGTVAVTDDVLFFYRRTPGSTTMTWRPKRLDVLDVVDSISRKSVGIGERMEKAARSRCFSAAFNMFLLCRANGYAAGADRCWTLIKDLRCGMLRDPEVRLKNKLGALLSYAGRTVTSLFAY